MGENLTVYILEVRLDVYRADLSVQPAVTSRQRRPGDVSQLDG